MGAIACCVCTCCIIFIVSRMINKKGKKSKKSSDITEINDPPIYDQNSNIDHENGKKGSMNWKNPIYKSYNGKESTSTNITNMNNNGNIELLQDDGLNNNNDGIIDEQVEQMHTLASLVIGTDNILAVSETNFNVGSLSTVNKQNMLDS